MALGRYCPPALAVRASAAKRNRGGTVVAQRERGRHRVVFATGDRPDPEKG